jgi:hypothetical protein
MEISYTNRFVFVHVGKAGGESIAAALRPYASDGVWRLDRPRWKHATARSIRKHFLVEPRQWRTFFSFAVLRNPWEWLHSLWHYKRMMAAHFSIEPPPAEFDAYRQQVEELASWPFDRWVEYAAEHYGRRRGGLLRHWCSDAQGQQLVRYVARFDRLAAEWPAILDGCGLPADVELPRHNVTLLPDGSPRPHYADEYTDELRRVVARAFSRDIDALGWRFGQSAI